MKKLFGTVFESTQPKRIKMKHIITLVGLLMLTNLTFAQDYNDLRILYADENYEKLVKEAEKYTEDDDTKYEAAPYFWAAKALYKISLSGTTDDNFKNAYKDAITFMSKGMKYDLKKNDGATIEEFEEFISEFQMSLYTRISNEMEAASFKKAYSWAVKYRKISQEETGINYVIGACKYQDGDRSSSRTAWQEADEMIKNVTDVDSWSEADRMMLKLGIIQTAKVYKETNQMAMAKETLNKAAQWFEEDEDWQVRYDDIVN